MSATAEDHAAEDHDQAGEERAVKPRSGPLRVTIGAALIAAAAGGVSWFAFVYARGVPGECGGDAPPCPPGTGSAFFVMTIAGLVLFPVGMALAGRRRLELHAVAIALGFGAIAAGVLVSRFVADPITTSTTVTWWFAGVTGAISLLALLVALVLAQGDRDEA